MSLPRTYVNLSVDTDDEEAEEHGWQQAAPLTETLNLLQKIRNNNVSSIRYVVPCQRNVTRRSREAHFRHASQSEQSLLVVSNRMRDFTDRQFWPSSQSPPKQPILARMQPLGNDKGCSVYASHPFRSTSELQVRRDRYVSSAERPSTDRGSRPRMVKGAIWHRQDFADSVGLPRETNVLSIHVGEPEKPKLVDRQRRRHEVKSAVSLVDGANGQPHTIGLPVPDKIRLPPSVLKTDQVSLSPAGNRGGSTTVTDIASVHSQIENVEVPWASELPKDVRTSEADEKKREVIIIECSRLDDVSSSSKESVRSDHEIVPDKVVAPVMKEKQTNSPKEIVSSFSSTQVALNDGESEQAVELERNSKIVVAEEPREDAKETNLIKHTTKRLIVSNDGLDKKCKSEKQLVLKTKSEKLPKKVNSDNKTQVRNKRSIGKTKDTKDRCRPKGLSVRSKVDKKPSGVKSVSKKNYELVHSKDDDEIKDVTGQNSINPKSVLRRSSESKKPKEKKSVQFDKELEFVRIVTKIEYPWYQKTREKKQKENSEHEDKDEDESIQTKKKKNKRQMKKDDKSSKDSKDDKSSEDDNDDKSSEDDNDDKSSEDDKSSDDNEESDDKSSEDDKDDKSSEDDKNNKSSEDANDNESSPDNDDKESGSDDNEDDEEK